MDNTEAFTALETKRDILTVMSQKINNTMALLQEYRSEMDNWKTDVVTAKIAVIKTEATAVEVDLSTWDGLAD